MNLLFFDNVRQQIEDGDFIAIMGASGSGKTTLLNIVGCMDIATDGEYFYDDMQVHSLKQNKRDEFRKNHIGFVFQNFALLKDYTVKDNIEIPLRAKGYGKKKRDIMVKEILVNYAVIPDEGLKDGEAVVVLTKERSKQER